MSIKTNKENRVIVTRLSSLFKFRNEAIISRIAINYTLQLNKKFDLDKISIFDNEGKEYKEETLFGILGENSNYPVYHALFDQHYEKNLTETEFSKLVKLHLDFGIEKLGNILLDKNKGRNAHIDYLISLVKNGINLINTGFPISTQTIKKDTPSYNGLIEFEIGNTNDGEIINIRLNDLNEFDSHHIAIAGMTGSGKTELVKDILCQIHKNSNGQLKFIFFDYKGEGKSDKIKPFIESTNSNFIDVLSGSFKFNPLGYINLSNENIRIANIKSFVDSVATIATGLGVKQKHILQTIITDCFDNISKGQYPTLQDVFKELQEYYQERDDDPDTLFSVISDMSSFLFKPEENGGKKIYDYNIYLNLPQTLSDTLRQLCVFLTLNYLLEEFNACNDTIPVENKLKPLRYVIVIDEAHVYLRNKNARTKLENLLRIIRSKGVVIIMLSQGPEDYKTKDFDFVSQVKIPICLNVNNKDYKIIKSFVGTPKSEISLKNAINELAGLYEIAL